MFGTLRYILAGLVVLAHLGPIDFKYTGYYAVLCFFTLSGYLLGLSYERYSDKNDFIAYGRFYFNRLLRVFPAYFCALIISIVVAIIFPFEAYATHPLFTMPDDFSLWFANIFVLNIGMFTGQIQSSLIIPSSWSLAVELFFWLFLPFAFASRRVLFIWLFFSFVVHVLLYVYQFPIGIRYFCIIGASISFAIGAALCRCKSVLEINMRHALFFLA